MHAPAATGGPRRYHSRRTTTCRGLGTGPACTRCDWPRRADQRVAVRQPTAGSRRPPPRSPPTLAPAGVRGAPACCRSVPVRLAARPWSCCRRDANPHRSAAWKAIEENDPLAKASVSIACASPRARGKANLHDVLAKLQSEGRKNILIVPAVFFADADWMRTLQGECAAIWRTR